MWSFEVTKIRGRGRLWACEAVTHCWQGDRFNGNLYPYSVVLASPSAYPKDFARVIVEVPVRILETAQV